MCETTKTLKLSFFFPIGQFGKVSRQAATDCSPASGPRLQPPETRRANGAKKKRKGRGQGGEECVYPLRSSSSTAQKVAPGTRGDPVHRRSRPRPFTLRLHPPHAYADSDLSLIQTDSVLRFNLTMDRSGRNEPVPANQALRA